MTIVAGVDVGGTFTDVVVSDSATGRTQTAKVLTTADQADGLLRGLAAAGGDPRELAGLVHGTTVATNAIIERSGAQAALVTTAGFRDVLELRRRDRPHTYGLTGTHRPLIPRSRCLEVVERIQADGKELVALYDQSVDALLQRLGALEVAAVAVCLLNSHANPAHERIVGNAISERFPQLPVTLSCELAGEAGEFERASTAAVNSYVQPKLSGYLGSVAARLREAGFEHEVQVTQSSGGLMTASRAAREPARTALSGPAAGTVAAAHLADQAGFANVISADMGGTSFDVAVIPGGTPAVTTLSQLEFGVPLRLPMVDIHTIGAGGGSVAWVDRGGVLQVGPHSAGATPGPASYGRGGVEPTVTDANLVLGRLPAARSLGTESDFTLDREAARVAIRERIADPLGLDLDGAALAVVTVAGAKMAGAIRSVSVDRGVDPRRFALAAFGGAGPLHAVELARHIGCRHVLVPARPGLACAVGCLVADARCDEVTAVEELVANTTQEQVRVALQEQRDAAIRQLGAEGFDADRLTISHQADMSYVKQLYPIRVDLGAGEWTPERLAAAFADAYSALYGGRLRASLVKLVNLRTTVMGRKESSSPQFAADDPPPHERSRDVVFDTGRHATKVLARHDIPSDRPLDGPCVIEQSDTTVLIPPGARVHAHPSGSLIVEV